LADPSKHWKFSLEDLTDRALWGDYQAAYEDAINETATDDAPWYVVPANHKWYRNLVIARTIADTLDAMDPRYPEPDLPPEGIEIPD
jgi:polyphosphate kinase 2 (PPK2 family)